MWGLCRKSLVARQPFCVGNKMLSVTQARNRGTLGIFEELNNLVWKHS
nr:MAG TPA: Spore coat associated protein JA (CotJA) [Caudoviricetes sp.]